VISPISSASIRRTAESLFFDIFALLAAILFFTGAGFLFSGPLRELIGQKPWIHRACVTMLPVAVIVWAAWRNLVMKPGSAGASFVQTFVLFSFKKPVLTLHLIFLFLAITWSISSWFRHAALHSSFDFAIFVQAVWNTLQGNFLYSSIKGGICLLGDHFSPFLAVLALPYAVWTAPECLLVLQAFSAASIVYPVYKLLKIQNPSGNAPLLFVFATALYLPIRNAVRFDFHPEVMTMPLLLWAFYFLTIQRVFSASLCMIVALSAKENTALVLAGMGAYACFGPSANRRFGLFWLTASVLYFFACVKFWIPHFSGAEYFYLSGNFLSWQNLTPTSLWNHLISISSAVYLIKIFAPFAFLSFLNPAALFLTLPMLAQNLLSRNEATRSIFFQYTALLTPFVIISAAAGWKRVAHLRVATYALIAASVSFAGVSEFYLIGEHAAKITPHTKLVRSHLQEIPHEASLRTHEFLAAHAAHRSELHIYENNHPREGGSPKARSSEYVALDRSFIASDQHPEQELAASGYREMFSAAGFTIWRRPSEEGE